MWSPFRSPVRLPASPGRKSLASSRTAESGSNYGTNAVILTWPCGSPELAISTRFARCWPRPCPASATNSVAAWPPIRSRRSCSIPARINTSGTFASLAAAPSPASGNVWCRVVAASPSFEESEGSDGVERRLRKAALSGCLTAPPASCGERLRFHYRKVTINSGTVLDERGCLSPHDLFVEDCLDGSPSAPPWGLVARQSRQSGRRALLLPLQTAATPPKSQMRIVLGIAQAHWTIDATGIEVFSGGLHSESRVNLSPRLAGLDCPAFPRSDATCLGSFREDSILPLVVSACWAADLAFEECEGPFPAGPFCDPPVWAVHGLADSWFCGSCKVSKELSLGWEHCREMSSNESEEGVITISSLLRLRRTPERACRHQPWPGKDAHSVAELLENDDARSGRALRCSGMHGRLRGSVNLHKRWPDVECPLLKRSLTTMSGWRLSHLRSLAKQSGDLRVGVPDPVAPPNG